MTEILVEISNLNKTFHIKEGAFHKKAALRALVNINLDIKKGETLGLVGESGSGKSTLGRCVLRLMEPDSGSVLYEGKDILTLSGELLREKRKDMQMIFQDPRASLDPRMKAEDIIAEGHRIHKTYSKEEIANNVSELMRKCGLNEDMRSKKPHEFSGGQRQRIAIARALALKPKFIVCDEAVSALDVSVQAQIVNLLIDLQREFGLAYLFISHDLKLVEQISDRVAIMYLGRILEKKRSDKIRTAPIHPYTHMLLSSIIEANDSREKELLVEEDVPSLLTPPSGCVFHTRCFMRKEICMKEEPKLKEIGAEHYAACHFM